MAEAAVLPHEAITISGYMPCIWDLHAAYEIGIQTCAVALIDPIFFVPCAGAVATVSRHAS